MTRDDISKAYLRNTHPAKTQAQRMADAKAYLAALAAAAR